MGDAENAKRGDEKGAWSAPFVLARAPGAPATHRDPALFFVGGVLRLHFRVGDEEDASPHAAASRDGGETWSGVSSLRFENAGETTSSSRDACAVGGTLPARPGSNGVPGAVACVGAIDAASHATHGVSVLVSADAGDSFTRAASVACCGAGGETNVASASLWRHAEASASAGGRHVTSLVVLGADGLVYRAQSPDAGATWGNAERLDPETLDARAVPAGGISAVAVGRRAAVMARVFFLPASKASAEADGPNANARVVVRLRLSDDGGTTWPLWLDVPVPGGCARSLTGPGGASARAELRTERCAAPVVEPWPERGEGLTVSFGGGGAGGIAFAATSLRAFREGAAAGSDAEASSGSIGTR